MPDGHTVCRPNLQRKTTRLLDSGIVIKPDMLIKSAVRSEQRENEQMRSLCHQADSTSCVAQHGSNSLLLHQQSAEARLREAGGVSHEAAV